MHVEVPDLFDNVAVVTLRFNRIECFHSDYLSLVSGFRAMVVMNLVDRLILVLSYCMYTVNGQGKQ